MSPGSDFGLRVNGFTLIEMMLVVGIMAIVLAIGLPPMVRVLDREPLRQAVSDVVEGVSHARAQAILHGRRSEMVINGDGQIIVRIAPARAPRPPAGEVGMGAAGVEMIGGSISTPLFEATLGAEVAITSVQVNGGPDLVQVSGEGEARVRFYPNGTSDDFKVEFRDSTGARRITLDPVTGFADVITLP